MKKHLLFLTSVLLISQASAQTASEKSEKETRAEWKKMDEAELASLPDSIKQRPKKLYPNASFIYWNVSGLYDATIFDKYKRPKMADFTYYSKDTLPPEAMKDRIWYTCSVTDTSRGEVHDKIGELVYYRNKDSKTVTFHRFKKFYRPDEAKSVMPPDVLGKIAKELSEQSGDTLTGFSLIHDAEASVYAAVYKGDKEKTWTANKKTDIKSYYLVWGYSNNGKFAPCFFDMKGNYIPNYKRDKCCNKKITLK